MTLTTRNTFSIFVVGRATPHSQDPWWEWNEGYQERIQSIWQRCSYPLVDSWHMLPLAGCWSLQGGWHGGRVGNRDSCLRLSEDRQRGNSVMNRTLNRSMLVFLWLRTLPNFACVRFHYKTWSKVLGPESSPGQFLQSFSIARGFPAWENWLGNNEEGEHWTYGVMLASSPKAKLPGQ